jgi:hypothetical protein
MARIGWKFVNTATFILMSFFLLLFYWMIFLGLESSLAKVAFLGGLVLILLGLTKEKQKLKLERFLLAKEVDIVVITPVAAILTYGLSQFIPSVGMSMVGPVISVSAIGLAFSLLAPKFEMEGLVSPFFCGAIVGMSSYAVIAQPVIIVVGGMVAGLLYIASHEIYVGSGGTLGTVAFSSVLITRRGIIRALEIILGVNLGV